MLYFKRLNKGLHTIIWKAPIFLAERESPRGNCGKGIRNKEGVI